MSGYDRRQRLLQDLASAIAEPPIAAFTPAELQQRLIASEKSGAHAPVGPPRLGIGRDFRRAVAALRASRPDPGLAGRVDPTRCGASGKAQSGDGSKFLTASARLERWL